MLCCLMKALRDATSGLELLGNLGEDTHHRLAGYDPLRRHRRLSGGRGRATRRSIGLLLRDSDENRLADQRHGKGLAGLHIAADTNTIGFARTVDVLGFRCGDGRLLRQSGVTEVFADSQLSRAKRSGDSNGAQNSPHDL